MKRVLLLFALLSLIGAGCFRSGGEQTVEMGASRFGRVVGGPVDKSEIAGGWVRPYPGPFWWDRIETSQDEYQWTETDQTVEYWQQRDQAILATLWPFAQWDQERCHSQETKVKHPFEAQDVWLRHVCHNDSYQEWVRAVVERYDGDGTEDMPGLRYPITHWEIGNEPDRQTDERVFFQSSPDAYAELYRLGFEAIKQADPSATVILAGMSSMSNIAQAFWKPVLEGEKDRMELLNIHAHATSSNFLSKEYHEYLDRLDLAGKEYWITEARVGSDWQDWDEEQQARMTLVSYVQAFANGAERIFQMDLEEYGGGIGQAAEQTFALVVKTIDGFKSVQWIGKESLILFTLKDREVYALWDDVELPLNVQGNVQTIDYKGTIQTQDARTVRAHEPLFVVVIKETE